MVRAAGAGWFPPTNLGWVLRKGRGWHVAVVRMEGGMLGKFSYRSAVI